ncbi:hypothetical protein Q8A67_004501 [Cirrhinus molitorella]|uniref:Uncharacterized protein n=1 Tax=Cirrhinus molitorella TaxID=172907 RepID=A0AA88Q0V9_9TELE|nr:hypothetical protein Q8A67_004501 [Cirrhinus molitorella]
MQWTLVYFYLKHIFKLKFNEPHKLRVTQHRCTCSVDVCVFVSRLGSKEFVTHRPRRCLGKASAVWSVRQCVELPTATGKPGMSMASAASHSAHSGNSLTQFRMGRGSSQIHCGPSLIDCALEFIEVAMAYADTFLNFLLHI